MQILLIIDLDNEQAWHVLHFVVSIYSEFQSLDEK